MSQSRNINGILLLDKPLGESSNRALQTVKKLLRAKKAGHTGSLDPLASGMLPLCFGEATKFSQYLLDTYKTYSVTAKLGVRTTTSDAEGDVVSQRPVPAMTRDDIDSSLSSFRGEIDQVPSMYSALKHNGKPLYQLARQGITVDRPSRRLTIYQCEVTGVSGDEVSLLVKCSKGTYIRTLVDDWGELIGCGAHVVFLNRTSVGDYHQDQMVGMDQIRFACENNQVDALLREHILPIDTSLHDLERIELPPLLVKIFNQGRAVFVPGVVSQGCVQVFSQQQHFLGVGQVQSDGAIYPKRLLRSQY